MRARAGDGAVDGEAAAGGRRRLRHPRPARVLHGRPRPPHGQRVHLPVLRGAERVDDERGRRDEDRRELPALLQHPRQRVPRLRRQLRGRAPHRAAGGAAGGGTPAAAGGTEEITYHDSCYLARHNDVLAPPREIVSRIGRPLEMARNGKRTFCCGAGGAHMWLEERGNQINEERAARRPRRAPRPWRSRARSAPSCSTTEPARTARRSGSPTWRRCSRSASRARRRTPRPRAFGAQGASSRSASISTSTASIAARRSSSWSSGRFESRSSRTARYRRGAPPARGCPGGQLDHDLPSVGGAAPPLHEPAALETLHHPRQRGLGDPFALGEPPDRLGAPRPGSRGRSPSPGAGGPLACRQRRRLSWPFAGGGARRSRPIVSLRILAPGISYALTILLGARCAPASGGTSCDLPHAGLCRVTYALSQTMLIRRVPEIEAELGTTRAASRR